MCGISGFFLNKEKKKSEVIYKETLALMSKKISHRGPDNNNLWYDLDNQIYFGHNRLKIIDLSDAGNQPIFSYTGKFTIIYNGEIYNHIEIKKKLLKESKNSINFKSETDTEILINAIDFWGLKRTLNEINGMYSFAIWNKEQKVLTLCRDRFGEKPLYYFFNDEGLFFSSEIKSFSCLKVSEKISLKNLDYFKYYGYNIDNKTIYENVKILPPGSFINFEKKNIK